MHPRNRMFILAALIYALVGGVVGLVWLVAPSLVPGNGPRIHGHLMLLGFVGMMIYGVALHVLPRFSGRSLFSERMGHAQFGLANLGLLVMVAGWLALHDSIVMIGGTMAWLVVAGTSLPLGGLFLDGAARPAALHGFTLGFVLLLIMGLGEHMLPRFTGHPIAGGWLWAWTPQALVHVSVLALGTGWLIDLPLLATAGALGALVLFAIRVSPLLLRRSL